MVKIIPHYDFVCIVLVMNKDKPLITYAFFLEGRAADGKVSATVLKAFHVCILKDYSAL